MLAKDTISLAEQLRRRIASEGPISVHDFMETCLADPVSGYYIARQPIGSWMRMSSGIGKRQPESTVFRAALTGNPPT